MDCPEMDYSVFAPAAPYFDLTRQALGDLVDGAHFFDSFAEQAIFEVLYDFPGWPRIVAGRAELMARFRTYVEAIALQGADHLIVHRGADGKTVILEYEVHGRILATGASYDNRFCSILRIEDRRIVHWRDYMDSLAAWTALTAPAKTERAG